MTVCVLLSTYNGQLYLEEQIVSVLEQADINVCLLVRDDGSTDSTAEHLMRFQNDNRMKVISGGGNLGAAGSFLRLLECAPSDCAYFAFCDQDDVWHKDKLTRAVHALAPFTESIPAMYCSRLEIVDSHLQPLGLSRVPTRIGFGNAIVENVAAGCTMVLNEKARSLILSALPRQCYMHDWWIYLVISCFGKIIYDSTPTICYRQHEKNAVGVGVGRRSELSRRLGQLKDKDGGVFISSKQAMQLFEAYGTRMAGNNEDLVRKFIRGKNSFIVRVGLALSKKIWRQRRFDDVALRFLILFNRY